MANDKEKPKDNADAKPSSKRDRVIGEGMTSLDSTQVPLKAESGEPDYEAIKGGKNNNIKPK